MLNRLLPVLILNLVAVRGYAAGVCNTLPECLQQKTQLSSSLAAVDANLRSLDLGDVARVKDAEDYDDHDWDRITIRWFYQSKESYFESIGRSLPNGELGAVEYCAKQGMHLPSAREFAQIASRACTPDLAGKEPCGAAGISETAKDGYYKINAKNIDGKADIFYFSNSGYNSPKGAKGQWMWTSSTRIRSQFGAFDISSFYWGDFLGLQVASGGSEMAVRCVRGYAAGVCGTWPECLQQKTQLSAYLAAVEARIQALKPLPQLDDIARNPDKSVRMFEYMTSFGKPLPNGDFGAVEYCASQGMHLPSARELAQIASRWCTPELAGKEPCGAAGISETAKDGYVYVPTLSADGKADKFYFSSAGYMRPAGDLGENSFWSSSYDWFDVGAYKPSIFFLSGNHGGLGGRLGGERRPVKLAVRCVRGQ
jgi:hypothetical protein